MVQCDVFEVKVDLEDESGRPYLVWTFHTDLLAGTQVILACERTFSDMLGATCLWTGHNERLEVHPNVHGNYNGANGRIEVYASDKKARELFEEISTGSAPAIKTPVSDEMILSFTVGARQKLRAYGRNNTELRGKMVSANGDINVVVVSKSICIPMQRELQPLDM